MKEPKRWRDFDGGADAEIRALLLRPAAVNPSRSDVNKIWASLSAQLDITLAAPGPQGSQTQLATPDHAHGPQLGPTVAAAGTGALSGKATLAVLVLATVGGVVGVRAVSVRDRHDPMVAPQAVSGALHPSLSSARSPESPISPQLPAPAVTSAPATAVSESRSRSDRLARPRSVARPATAPVSVNALLEEGRRLDQARTALRAHDADRALQLLSVNPGGTSELAQEREALMIEAQAAKPALRAKANEAARAFMRAYPESPYRARIKAIVFGGE